MAYLVVYRSADTLWITVVMQWSRNAAQFGCKVKDEAVYNLRNNACMDRFCDIVQDCDIDLGALADARDLVCIFNHFPCRNRMSLVGDACDFVVK